jgi:Fic/DOC family
LEAIRIMSRLSVIEYVAEEVSRQGHDVTRMDGIERVGWMLNAWGYALRQSASGKPPTMAIARKLGMMVEPVKNKSGFRTCQVQVGCRRCPDFAEVPDLLSKLFSRIDSLKPLEFYRAYEEVHPFLDGNGRSGKILLAWKSGTLMRPEFPPDDFWGFPIRNP